MTDLIVDFPHKRNRQAVRFAHMAQVHVVTRHCETHNVARHELWYTETDYHRMRIEIRLDAETKRLALLMALRSSVSFSRSNLSSPLADERRQDKVLSIESNIISYPA